MIRTFFILFALMVPLTLHTADENPVDYAHEIESLDKSIAMLSKWQGQYRKKREGLKKYIRRSLFREKSFKDAQRSERQAQDAYENMQELQAQIDQLKTRRQELIDAMP